jgi:hypothetical protein
MCDNCERDQNRARKLVDKMINKTMDEGIPPNHVLVVLYEKVAQFEELLGKIPYDKVVRDNSFDPKYLKHIAKSNLLLKKGVAYGDFEAPEIVER